MFFFAKNVDNGSCQRQHLRTVVISVRANRHYQQKLLPPRRVGNLTSQVSAEHDRKGGKHTRVADPLGFCRGYRILKYQQKYKYDITEKKTSSHHDTI